MDRRSYGYAALRHTWGGRQRNIGAVVHSAERRFFHIRALRHGDLVRRLRDVPAEEIERVERELWALNAAGRAALAEPGLLDQLARAPAGRLAVGTTHRSSAQRLRWALDRHFRDYAHPEIAE